MDNMQPEMNIDAHGTKRWTLRNERHRVDGPAIIHPDGGKLWYLCGELHRTDGPAIEWSDGGNQWWLCGELHRTDGPAIEWHDGDKEWWLHGDPRSFEDWLEANTEISDEEKVMLKLQYG